MPRRLSISKYADEGLLSIKDPGKRHKEGLKKLSPPKISYVSLESFVEGWEVFGNEHRFWVGQVGLGEERGWICHVYELESEWESYG